MQKKQWIWSLGIAGILIILAPFIVDSATRPYVRIDNGATRVTSREVILSLLGPSNVRSMRISNDGVFDTEVWEPYRSQKEWTLDYGRGTKRVYVQFRTLQGEIDRTTYQDTIILSIPTTMTVSLAIDDTERDTTSRYVPLDLTYSAGVEEVRFSESAQFTGAEWLPVQDRMLYVLSDASGTKTIYAEFRDGNNTTKVVSDTVVYTPSPGALKSGTVLQGQQGYLFYYGVDGQIHPFFDSVVYHSWYDNFDEVVSVSNQKLASYLIGEPVCMRAGSWLVKFPHDPRVYAVELGCVLRPIYSQIEAYVLYGPQWEQRIHELPVSLQSAYRVRDPRTIYTDTDVIDADKDGVPSTVEEEYGTRDDRFDSDSDGISDYEEIYFWFTDPTDADSDDDSFSDGREILAGYNPLGLGALSRIPENTYQYPEGSLVRNPKNGTLYYVGFDYTYLIVGSTRSSEFTSNRLLERFIITPAFDMTLRPLDTRRLKIDQEVVRYPSVSNRQFTVLPL